MTHEDQGWTVVGSRRASPPTVTTSHASCALTGAQYFVACPAIACPAKTKKNKAETGSPKKPLRSAMKGSRPMVVSKHTTYYEKREVGFAHELSDVTEIVETAQIKAYRTSPEPLTPDYPDWLHDPFTDNNPDKELFALAEARDRALQLAKDVDTFVDSATRSRGGCRRENDDRRAAVVWTKDGGLMYNHTFSQRERDDRMLIGAYRVSDFIPVARVRPDYQSKWDELYHLGQVPDRAASPASKTKPQTKSMPKSVPKTFADVLAEVEIADFNATILHVGAEDDSNDAKDVLSTKAVEENVELSPAEAEAAKIRDKKLKLILRKYEARRSKGHVPSASEPHPSSQAAAAKPEAKVDLWLVDTGCGHDLISESDVLKLKKWVKKAKFPITFITANGTTHADKVVELFVKEFGETIEPYLLKSSPAVVSVGFRCMNLGYTFIWPPGSSPYFISPKGDVIYLEVINDIPYLRPGSQGCKPKKPSGKLCFACGAVGGYSKCFNCRGDCGGKAGQPAAPGAADDVPPPPVPPPPAPPHVDPADIADEEEADRVLPPTMRRDLRAEAQSVGHLLRHFPANPYCEACRRGKMRKVKRYKGSFVNDASFWGQHLTADHITSVKDNMLGVTNDKNALVIQDMYSKLRHLYPTNTKNAEETTMCIRKFSGDRGIRRLYSDNSGEIGAALKQLKIMPHNSLPGEPQTNAVAERNNGSILAGSRTTLVRAGLPACFWPFATEHYCLMENVHFTDSESSPYCKTHGDEFDGALIPFGAKVIFRPAETKGVEKSKFEEPTITGIFAGYELAPGYKWSGTYRVWALDDFAGESLAADVKLTKAKFRDPHIVQRVELPVDGISFPLKTEYERINHTLEGATERLLEQRGLFDVPGDHDPDEPRRGADQWLRCGNHWIRIHSNPRRRLCNPSGLDGGPDPDKLLA